MPLPRLSSPHGVAGIEAVQFTAADRLDNSKVITIQKKRNFKQIMFFCQSQQGKKHKILNRWLVTVAAGSQQTLCIWDWKVLRLSSFPIDFVKKERLLDNLATDNLAPRVNPI